MPEGRWVKTPSGSMGAEYYLKDHLGNLRVSCACDKTKGTLAVLQENHYDPWGLNLPIGLEGKDRYLYNGKEYQKDLGLYEYGFRWYSPDNTRFIPQKTATDLVNFAQTMDWNKAKTVAITLGEGLVNYDAVEFDKGGIYAWHATGKVGGSLALNGAALLAIVADVPNTLKKASDILKDWVVDLSKVRKIGGSVPKNALSYTGKKYSFDVNANPPLQAKYKGEVLSAVRARLDALHVNYPNGVDFDEFGFARFEPYTVKVMKNGVEVEAKVTVQTTGNRNADFAAADAQMGISEAYRVDNQLVWHHVEDTKTMILVPKDIHTEVKHTGGIGVYKNDINYED